MAGGGTGERTWEKSVRRRTRRTNYATRQRAATITASFIKMKLPFAGTSCYPPFSAMCMLRFSGGDDKETYASAAAACADMRKQQNAAVEILGPARAELPKLNNKYRWIITLKGERRKELTAFLAHWTDHGKMLKKIRGRANLSILFDGR